MFAIKRSMIAHDSLSKSRRVLASLTGTQSPTACDCKQIWRGFEFRDENGCVLEFVLTYLQFFLRFSSYIPIVVVIAKIFHKHDRASYSSIRLHIKLPLRFSLPGFLDFFAFLTFSLSASLSSEYLSKLLLCCSSQDDCNAVAILH